MESLSSIIRRNTEISDPDMLIRKGLYSYKVFDENDYNFTKKYYVLYRNYKRLLDRYLLNALSLQQYDDRLSSSGLRFSPVPIKYMDYYQFMSKMGLKFFYLRNHIFVEKLSEDDINAINRLRWSEVLDPGDETMEIIERTWRMVIDYCSGKGMPGMSLYGLDYPKNWHDSSELVFGFRYDEFAENGLGQDDLWLDNYFKQTEFINDLLDEMHVKTTAIVGNNVNINRYGDYTIDQPVLFPHDRIKKEEKKTGQIRAFLSKFSLKELM